MISLLIRNVAENKNRLAHLSQIMSFRGPSYTRRDLHLLHAQVLSRNNESLPYKTLGTERRYSTESRRDKNGDEHQKTPGILAY